MLEIIRSSQFKEDLKKIIKQGKDFKAIEKTVLPHQKSCYVNFFTSQSSSMLANKIPA